MAALNSEEDWQACGEGYDDEVDDEGDDLWDDMDEESMVQDTPVKCLFCEEVFATPHEVLLHCKEKANFDLLELSCRAGINSWVYQSFFCFFFL